MNARKRIQDIETKVNPQPERADDSELRQLEIKQLFGGLTPEEEERLEELISLDPYRAQLRRYHTGEDPPPPKPPEEHTRKAAIDYYQQFGRWPAWYAANAYWYEKELEPVFRRLEAEQREREHDDSTGL